MRAQLAAAASSLGAGSCSEPSSDLVAAVTYGVKAPRVPYDIQSRPNRLP